MKKTTVMPERTVFSINPATTLPFCTEQEASLIIDKHITCKAQNIVHKYSADDIKQNILLRLCISKFNPELSAAKTFITLVCITACRKFFNDLKVRSKHLEVRDFLINEDGESFIETYSTTDSINPENYLLTNEYLAEFYRKTKNRSGARPPGFKRVGPKPKMTQEIK